MLRSCNVRCRASGCKGLTKHPSGYCDAHSSMRYHRGNAGAGNDAEAHALYNSRKWRAWSRAHRAANPLCINYSKCRGFAQVVDHIKQISDGGNQWDKSNMQSMCHRCHNVKRSGESRKDSDSKAEDGLELVWSIKAKQSMV